MKKDYLKDEGNVLRVQKHQLNNTTEKLSDMDRVLSDIQKVQENSDNLLDDMLNEMEHLLQNNHAEISTDSLSEYISIVEEEISVSIDKENVLQLEEIDKVEFDKEQSWDEYLQSIDQYAFRYNIDLEEDPFRHLMSPSQQIELQKRIKEEFTLKNAKCDKYDYMIAGVCGVIGGLIDILFVGAPGDSELGEFTDEQAGKVTEIFAEILGWDKDKAVEKGKNTTASAIGFLEQKFKINYDHATTYATGGKVKNLSLKNHHLKSLGHSPDIIGLFFSILNQFTNTSSFINNGEIITIETEDFELQGHNFIAKLFCGFANWFGHIMSDWTGSSGTVGQGGRGTGVPLPFYNLFQMMNIGEFGQHKQSFATMTTKVFEQGYDARHGITMAIPVVTTELLIRFMYTMKARFYHEKSWKNSLPNGNIPELRRMLLVGHGSLCIIDGADAYIRSGSGADMVEFLSRTNLIAWTRLGHLAIKEVYAWYNSGHIDADAVDEYLDKELTEMRRNMIR